MGAPAEKTANVNPAGLSRLASKNSATHDAMANAIRALAMDAVEAANSGHPGMPMGMADVATVLFRDVLKYNPEHPHWPDRDRFVLSAGHGSMLHYALLYLTGYQDMTIDEIKRFRQWGAKTAGHPEFGHATGIETTTGPLGQGLANAVGMALAERMLAARYGDIVDHFTYTIAGDGCLMEGISQEAISLAGHLKLSRLIVLFDDNHISIDGPTSLTTSDDHLARFKASGWDVQAIDGHDEKAILESIKKAQGTNTPSLIACKTTIGYGAPTKAGSASSHGAALGKEEIAGARTRLGWDAPPFEIPTPILADWRKAGAKGAKAYEAWKQVFDKKDAHTQSEFTRTVTGDLPEDWVADMLVLKEKIAAAQPGDATRKSSEIALETLAASIPEMIGGSADLTGSNNTKTKALAPVKPGDYAGRYLYYGVREHAMAAAMNGMALHGGFIPYGGTFMVFTDYCRPSIRLAALMRQRVIYVMTHDSIGLGEDGPTHQPVEHLASLRAIPNLQVFRPADATETLECWALALASKHTPSVLSLTRQNVPSLRKTFVKENICAYGAYVISDCEGAPKAVLLATGSEVYLAVEAQAKLKEKNVAARVVSMPSWELFEQQNADYKKKILGHNTVRVAIEAAGGFGWERYLGEGGTFIGMKGFGASAPAKDLYREFGITSDAVVKAVMEKL